MFHDLRYLVPTRTTTAVGPLSETESAAAVFAGAQVLPTSDRTPPRAATGLTLPVVILLLLASVVGCGGDRVERIPVRGQVLYQDKPVGFGNIMFQPLGGGEIARGAIQSDGSFVLSTKQDGDGVQVAQCRVRVTAFEAQRGEAADPSKMEMPMGESAIPEKYQSFGASGIVVVVAPEMEQPVIISLE